MDEAEEMASRPPEAYDSPTERKLAAHLKGALAMKDFWVRRCGNLENELERSKGIIEMGGEILREWLQKGAADLMTDYARLLKENEQLRGAS